MQIFLRESHLKWDIYSVLNPCSMLSKERQRQQTLLLRDTPHTINPASSLMEKYWRPFHAAATKRTWAALYGLGSSFTWRSWILWWYLRFSVSTWFISTRTGFSGSTMLWNGSFPVTAAQSITLIAHATCLHSKYCRFDSLTDVYHLQVGSPSLRAS